MGWPRRIDQKTRAEIIRRFKAGEAGPALAAEFRVSPEYPRVLDRRAVLRAEGRRWWPTKSEGVRP